MSAATLAVVGYDRESPVVSNKCISPLLSGLSQEEYMSQGPCSQEPPRGVAELWAVEYGRKCVPPAGLASNTPGETLHAHCLSSQLDVEDPVGGTTGLLKDGRATG